MSVKNMMSEYVRISKYSRYNKEKKRRETWEEQIERMMKMHEIHLGDKIDLIREDFDFAKKMLLEKRVLGSQRALQFGGEAILNKNVRCYNCSFTYCEYVKAFQYLTFLSLAGVGVGLSVQYDHINKLPDIASRKNGKKVFKVEDSIEGWADAIGVLMSSYFVNDCSFPEYQGYEVEFDLTGIRPKGSKLSYTGGKAPGPDPLARAIKSIEKLIDERLTNSNRLAPIDCADIACFCADCSVAGGIRRSAIIILFSKEDNEMMKAKTGSWFIDNPQRVRSNNSVVLLRNNTTKEEFDEIMKSVKEFGEPGFIFSDNVDFGVNPCVEAGFYARDEFGNPGFEFCNLSEVNAKLCKTADMFYESCRAASILGTIQASYTDFPYLGEITKRITEREALLGVSITGMMDNVEIVFDPEIQRNGAEIVKQTNQRIANIIGIRPAARTTCVKPSGTASTLLGTSSGIHPNHSRRYLRRIRANKNEPTLQFYEMFNPKAVEEDYTSINKTDKVITFLCEVPKNARTKVDTPALTLLEYVKSTKINWVDAGRVDEFCTTPWAKHNISNTINCRDDEYDDVANFIFDNREYFTGISLLPQSGDLDYIQAPFTVIKTPDEIIKTYGSGSLLASGVIVNACRVFNDNLWAACDCVLGIGERLDDLNISGMSHEVASVYINQQLNKKQWVERAKKFAVNYFDGDLRKMTYCLKDVNNYKTWVDIERTHVDVPWEMLTEEVDNTKVEQSVACAGGQCEV